MDANIRESFEPAPEVARRLSVSRSKLYAMVQAGQFPKPIRISENRVAWPASRVSAWIAAKIAEAA